MANHSPSRLMALLHIRIIASPILHFLPRSSLKTLRLASKALDELVLRESYLFSRVYLSSNYSDLHTLEQVSNHPRIARCATTLVWDLCTGPNLDGSLYVSSWGIPENVLTQIERIASEYAEISDAALDFRALMAAIPRLPRLRAVVFTNQMGRWTVLNHNPQIQWPAPAKANDLEPTRMFLPSYESPAMRAWKALRPYPLRDFHNRPPAGSVMSDPGRDLQVLPRLRSWAETIRRGDHTTTADEVLALMDILSRLRHKSHRELLLCLIAFEAHGRTLQSLCIEASPSQARHRVSGIQFKGFDIHLFLNLDPGLAGLSDMFRTLRKLVLCLDNSPRNGMQADWQRGIRKLLHSAEYLQRLELRLLQLEELGEGLFHPSNSNSSLEVLVLELFVVTTVEVEEKLLPWSARAGLRTLQLIDCSFVLPAGMDDMAFIRLLAERDISLDELDSCPPPSYRQQVDEDCDSPSGNEGSEGSSDNSSIDDPWLAAREDPKLHHEDADAPRIQFMDIDFESACSGHNSDDSDKDSTYFPYTDALWSRQMDAPFLNVDLDEPGWKGEMANLYYDMYHEDIIRRYDHEYDDDTPDLEDEYPMRPLRAGMVSGLPSVAGESFLFLLDGGSGEGSGLWLRIDHFSVHERQ
ncbi:hypothetical protein BJX62DRAFT_235326 [Aspergillus germanicus]